MAVTTADLEALDKAIASGVLSVTHEGRRVEYRSLNEMLRARERLARELGVSKTPLFRRTQFSRG